jgi:hypothetical protein
LQAGFTTAPIISLCRFVDGHPIDTTKAAVFLPELITYCSEDGLDLDSIKKLLGEEAEKEIIEESDAKILYQVISAGATELQPEFKEYKPVAISLGILKEIEKDRGSTALFLAHPDLELDLDNCSRYMKLFTRG